MVEFPQNKRGEAVNETDKQKAPQQVFTISDL